MLFQQWNRIQLKQKHLKIPQQRKETWKHGEWKDTVREYVLEGGRWVGITQARESNL